MACARTGPRQLTCLTPNGAGANLTALLWMDSATVGVGRGAVSYTPPTLTSICSAALAPPSEGSWATPYATAPPAYTSRTCITPASTGAGALLPLPALPANGDVLVFSGASLGPPITANCAFAAWGGWLSPCAAALAGVGCPSGGLRGPEPCASACLQIPGQMEAPCCRTAQDGSTPWGPAQGPGALQCLSYLPGQLTNGSGFPNADFPGEGQVAPGDVLYWSDALVVVRSPPGAGQRLVTLRATGQAPGGWPSETALNAAYDTPAITGALDVSFGAGSTSGGGTAFIPARHAPRMPYTEWFNASLSAWLAGNGSLALYAASGLPLSGVLQPPYPALFLPLPLPLLPPGQVYNNSGGLGGAAELGWQEPTETLVVWVGSHCLAPASTAYDGVANAITSALASCSVCSRASGVGCVTASDARGVSFIVPPGVGKNKPVRLGYVSARDNGLGANISAAFLSSALFSYSPPLITSMGDLNPAAQVITQPVVYSGGDTLISITGQNFGVPVYSGPGAWSAAELGLRVGVAGYPCSGPARGFSANPAIGNYVYCTLLAGDLAKLTVGFNSAFITIGAPPVDQTGTLPVGAPNSLYIACAGGALPVATAATFGSQASGTFGLVGQVCLPCPVGAQCPGYREDAFATPGAGGGGGDLSASSPAAAVAALAPLANPCSLGAGAAAWMPNCVGNVSSAWTSPCCLAVDPTLPEGAAFYAGALPPVPANFSQLWGSWQGAPLGAATWAGQVVYYAPPGAGASTTSAGGALLGGTPIAATAEGGVLRSVWPFTPPETSSPSADGTVPPALTSRLQYDRLVTPLAGGGVSARTIAHSLPVPSAGFFNLNGSMGGVCPPAALTRDGVCIVACTPATSCTGDNFCAPSYRSLPPTYRCSSCNLGFYSLNGACTPCPQSPWAVVIAILLAIICLGGLGWFLNKYNVRRPRSGQSAAAAARTRLHALARARARAHTHALPRAPPPPPRPPAPPRAGEHWPGVHWPGLCADAGHCQQRAGALAAAAQEPLPLLLRLQPEQ